MKSQKGLYNKKDKLGLFLSHWRNKVVMPHIKGEELIDLACGDNRLVKAHGRGKGLDIFDYGNADLVIANFTKLPFKDKSIDTVAIIASLNYLDEPMNVLLEVYRILKIDGKLIITMPNSLIMKFWHKFREPWAKNPGFSKFELGKLINKSGFKIERKKIFMFGLNNVYIIKKS